MITLNVQSLSLNPLRTNFDLFDLRITENTTLMDGVEQPLSHNSIRLLSPKLEEQMSPQINCYRSENSRGNSFCDAESRLMATSITAMHSIDPKFSIAALVSNEEMANCETQSNATSSYGHNMNSESNEDDYINYCSDDSELSVGNETDGTPLDRITNNSTNYMKRSASHQHHHQHQHQHRQNSIASLDQTYYQTKMPDIIRPNLTRQEEFLKRSHIYAGEILKHQFNFMSVTKGLNINAKANDDSLNCLMKPRSLSPINNNATLQSPLKIGLSRLQVYASDLELNRKWSMIEDRSSQSPTNFREIHSHLSAISKITSALGRESSTRIQIASPNSTTSRENSESPLSTNASTARNVLHNNLNDTNLKFSIDNILKPSFGRRITDPLHKLSSKTMRKTEHQQRDSNERMVTFDDTLKRNKA